MRKSTLRNVVATESNQREFFESPRRDLRLPASVVKPSRTVVLFELLGAAAVAVLATGVQRFAWWPVLIAALVLVCWVNELARLPLYERTTSFRGLRRCAGVVMSVLLAAVCLGWIDDAALRRGAVTAGLCLTVPLVLRLVRRLRHTQCRTLLVGDSIAVSHLITSWRTSGEAMPVGICLVEPDDDTTDPPGRTEIMGVPVLGKLEDVPLVAEGRLVHRVVVAPGPVLSAYDVRRIGWALEESRIEVAVAAEVHGAVARRIEPRVVAGRLLLSVRPPHQSVVSGFVKSTLDRLVGTVLTLLALPLIVVLAIMVRIDSPGPGLFRQERVGRGGKRFTMYKLRTMCTDAEVRKTELAELDQGAGLLFKIPEDPRITRLGKVLRQASLDELPQLINVMRGDMSLIGPRPALPSEVNEYDDWIRRRLSIKPGMTGLWQVSGRSNLPWNQAVRLDLDYVDNWTLGGDLSIARRTLRAVARREGAS